MAPFRGHAFKKEVVLTFALSLHNAKLALPHAIAIKISVTIHD